jgi:tetratricopeptide (TPR) repeat protein
MNDDRSPHNTADQYLQLFAGDEAMRASLLACSAGLSLDDGVASEAIEVVLPQPAQTQELLARIKRLGCVSHNWDGSWRISEDVRVGLADLLSRQFPADRLMAIRTRLASKAEHMASSLSPDGQITNYRVREARFQAAYQKLLMPGRVEEGAQLCAEIWRQASTDEREATCSAVDYVSDEVQRQVKELPPELLFLKGMAARARGNRNRAREYFYLVWKQGKPGDIFAIAAHLFGNLSFDRELAERALHDSLQWYDDRSHQGQVWHSLGNLLSRQSLRWKEAEGAYRKSLKLLHDPAHQGQVWHSLGNLLSRQNNRWQEAEEAYHASIQLLHDPADKGQVWHSLGNLLTRQSQRWKEAEEAYRKSLQLLYAPADKGQVWHSLGNLLSRRSSRWEEAEEAYRKSLQLLYAPADKGQVWHSLGNLLSRRSSRWEEAEEAYRKSLQLLHDPADQGQVYSSWAGAIVANRPLSEYDKAEEYAKLSLSLLPKDPRAQSTVNGILAKLYEAKGQYRQAIAALTAAIEAAERSKNWKLAGQRQQHLEELHRKI